MRKLRTLLASAALAAALLATAPAHALIAPFGGAATGTDPLGHSWSTANAAGKGHWGELGIGTLVFNPAGFKAPDNLTWANEFDFIFLVGVKGKIDQTPAVSPFGSEKTTRFANVTQGILWQTVFVSDKEVHFIAPAGTRINPGDQFFVNVAFTGATDLARFSFAGLWFANTAPMPEPATMALLGAGLVGLGLARRRGGGRK